jgi:predicted permease
METLFQDIRYALRSLRKSPGFALVAILTIGLAVGMNTVAFTWMERFVLKPLPGVPASDELIAVVSAGPGGDIWQMSYPNYRDWREGVRSFEGLTAQSFEELSLRTTGPAQRAWGVFAAANYFEVLRVRAALGRTFRPEEETQATPVAVISHGLWQRTFAGDSGVVGRHMMLNGHDFTIIGVAPEKFAGTIPVLRFDLWVPVTVYELLTPNRGLLTSRGDNNFDGIARLKPGVTIEQARQEINALNRRLAEQYPGELQNTTVSVRWFGDAGTTPFFRPLMGALLAVTVVVLLVACANLANLLLAKAAARRREIGIRLAVGAGRGRLVRQLLTESLLLALSGGVVGVLIALWGKDTMTALLPAAPYPIFVEFDLDSRVLGVALAVSVLTGVVFGLVPALQASRVDLVPALRDGAATGPAGRSRVQSALVASQVALSLVCLVCAGLFVRGLQRARSIDTGMREPQQVLLAGTDFFRAGYTDSTGPAALERLLERVRALPGVRSASVATGIPLSLNGMPSTGLSIEGYTFRPDEIAAIPFSQVGPDYFGTIGTPIVRGRGFTAEDRAKSLQVAVVSERFAQRYWAGQDPIGKHITVNERERTVVGVARNTGHDQIAGGAPPVFFRPVLQSWRSSLTLLVRTAGDPRALQQALRRAFEEVDPGLPVTDVRTLAEHIGAASFIQRIGAWVLAAFGMLALVLSAVGLFGVLSYSVAQRTREMGVRIAVGASRRDVLALVVGKAMRLTAIGLGVGIVLAAGAGQLLRSQILDVSPLDPVTFGAVIVLLAAVAFLAAWLPARRAARVDPVIALQAE